MLHQACTKLQKKPENECGVDINLQEYEKQSIVKDPKAVQKHHRIYSQLYPPTISSFIYESSIPVCSVADPGL
jgi:hypothetical protein